MRCLKISFSFAIFFFFGECNNHSCQMYIYPLLTKELVFAISETNLYICNTDGKCGGIKKFRSHEINLTKCDECMQEKIRSNIASMPVCKTKMNISFYPYPYLLSVSCPNMEVNDEFSQNSSDCSLMYKNIKSDLDTARFYVRAFQITGEVLSVVFLLITLLPYATVLFKRRQKSKALICGMILSLILENVFSLKFHSYIGTLDNTFAKGYNETERIECVIFSTLYYFSILFTMFWIILLGYNIMEGFRIFHSLCWKTKKILPFSCASTARKQLLCAILFTASTVVPTVICVLINELEMFRTESSNFQYLDPWFCSIGFLFGNADARHIWLVAPLCLLTVVNLLFLCSVCVHIVLTSRRVQKQLCHAALGRRRTLSTLKICLRLVAIMGILPVFYIAMYSERKFYHVKYEIADIFISWNGVLISVVLFPFSKLFGKKTQHGIRYKEKDSPAMSSQIRCNVVGNEIEIDSSSMGIRRTSSTY